MHDVPVGLVRTGSIMVSAGSNSLYLPSVNVMVTNAAHVPLLWATMDIAKLVPVTTAGRAGWNPKVKQSVLSVCTRLGT